MFAMQLREITKPYHDDLENHHLNQRLFSNNSNLEDYITFIDLQYCFWLNIEQQIKLYSSELNEFGIDFTSRANDALIELNNLNRTPSPLSYDATHINTLEGCLSALYLLEGSRHGAAVILKKAKEFMPPNYQFVFLQTDNALFITRWKTIINTIEICSKNKNDTQTNLINATISLYTSMQRFYDEYATLNRMR